MSLSIVLQECNTKLVLHQMIEYDALKTYDNTFINYL